MRRKAFANLKSVKSLFLRNFHFLPPGRRFLDAQSNRWRTGSLASGCLSCETWRLRTTRSTSRLVRAPSRTHAIQQYRNRRTPLTTLGQISKLEDSTARKRVPVPQRAVLKNVGSREVSENLAFSCGTLYIWRRGSSPRPSYVTPVGSFS